MARNDFDRPVHLSFGLLAVPAYSDVAIRHMKLGNRSALWSAFLFVGCISALYEIFEWLLTIFVAPDMAADYNGQQGDPWDSQKDMAIALIGAVAITAWRIARGVPSSSHALRSTS